MLHRVLFENEVLFGNAFLQSIPHPSGFLGEILKDLSIFCHFAGGITFFVFLLPFVYLCYSRLFGVQIALAALSTGIINGTMKIFGESARPLFISPEVEDLRKIANETSYGFPSGHAHVSVLIWGILFLQFKNIYFRTFAMFMILFTPFSRMYMGVHYPGDVIGGAFTGILSLFLIRLLFKKYPEFPNLSIIKEVDKRQKIARSISLALVAITLPATLLIRGEMTEQEFSSISQVTASAASFAGLFSGILYLKYIFGENYYDWGIAKNLPDFFVRLLAILLGIGVLYFGLGTIEKNFLKDEFLFRYIRYFILNLYLVLGVPLFLKKRFQGRFLSRTSE